MNERIKELIEQAGIESYPAKLLVNTDEEGKVSSKWEIPLEKFAELIVKECIDWCNAHARDDGTAQRIAEDIKKDFGVEE